MKDWIERAIKTFIQAFFGVLLPEAAALLSGGFPEVGTLWKVLSPLTAAALAAGISAVWNLVLEMKKEEARYESD